MRNATDKTWRRKPQLPQSAAFISINAGLDSSSSVRSVGKAIQLLVGAGKLIFRAANATPRPRKTNDNSCSDEAPHDCGRPMLKHRAPPSEPAPPERKTENCEQNRTGEGDHRKSRKARAVAF